MTKADFRVNAIWEAVPYSDNYYRLSSADKARVNALLVAEVDARIPPPQQLALQNISIPNSDYDDILTQMNALVLKTVTPPAGTAFVLPQTQASFWYPSPMGHKIMFFVQLLDMATGAVSPWEIAVSYTTKVTATYDARMGLAYECIPV